MTKRLVDEHEARTDEGKKLYKVDGFDNLQQLGYGFRIVKSEVGYRLQKQYTGKGRGENTQTIWADIPVVDLDGKFIGYEIK